MKNYILLLIGLLFISCSDSKDQKNESLKAAKKNEIIFKAIMKKWNFSFPIGRPEIQTTLANWNDWAQFKKELEQTPKTTLNAFQLKTKNIALKSDSLYVNIPEKFNIPQVKSRISTLSTKINALETYINLQEIPQKKVFSLIDEINAEINGLYNQWDEIIIKQAIPKEFGEENMLKALDTTRFANSKFLNETIEKNNKTEKH